MKQSISTFIFVMAAFLCRAQFPGPAGTAGSTAIFKDSSVFVAWGRECRVSRGLQDISTPSLGLTTVGDSSMVSGKADGGVVSLGDAGFAVVTFSAPITNGSGYDFAVFENAFNDSFLELAFVEVSSDGVNYVRFPSTSNSPVSPQYSNSAVMDAGKLDNLAGKYRAMYGTPFDLQQLAGNPQLNVNAITHVKIIDVVGSINTSYARYDKNNTIINDPWPTAFASGGFDLDAVGVINQASVGIKELNDNVRFVVYPNPFGSEINIHASSSNESIHVSLKNSLGEQLFQQKFSEQTFNFNTTDLIPGIYFVEINDGNRSYTYKMIRH